MSPRTTHAEVSFRSQHPALAPVPVLLQQSIERVERWNVTPVVPVADENRSNSVKSDWEKSIPVSDPGLSVNSPPSIGANTRRRREHVHDQHQSSSSFGAVNAPDPSPRHSRAKIQARESLSSSVSWEVPERSSNDQIPCTSSDAPRPRPRNQKGFEKEFAEATDEYCHGGTPDIRHLMPPPAVSEVRKIQRWPTQELSRTASPAPSAASHQSSASRASSHSSQSSAVSRVPADFKVKPGRRIVPAPIDHISTNVRDLLTHHQRVSYYDYFHQLGIDPKVTSHATGFVYDSRKVRCRDHNWRWRPEGIPPKFPDWMNDTITAKLDSSFPMNGTYALYTAAVLTLYPDDEEPTPRSCWVAVVRYDATIVYETFIRHPKEFIRNYQTEFHGLQATHVEFGISRTTALKQVTQFIAVAKTIVSDDPERHLQQLGYSAEQILIIRPKLVNLCHFYSPYTNLAPFNFRCIVHLILNGRVSFPEKHPPSYSAKLAIRLYFLSKELIDFPPYQWTGNTWIAKLLAIFFQKGDNWPEDLLTSCQYSSHQDPPHWNNGHGYANPDHWRTHHPSPDADPWMEHQVRIAREYNRDDLDDPFRGEQNVSPIDWSVAALESQQKQQNKDNVPSQPEATISAPENAPAKEARSLEIDSQVVPEAIPPMVPLSSLSPNAYNELSSIATSQDLHLSDEQNALLIQEHLNQASEEIAFSAASTLFNETIPSLQNPPSQDPEVDNAIRSIIECASQLSATPDSSGIHEPSISPERPADGNSFQTDPQRMETDDEPSPVFSPISTSTSFEFVAPSSQLPAVLALQSTASPEISSQDLPSRLQASTLDSSSSTSSPQVSPVHPQAPASKPESTQSQPPRRRCSSRAITPESSRDRTPSAHSSSSGTSLLQSVRIRTTPKLVVPKPKKKPVKGKEKKKKS